METKFPLRLAKMQMQVFNPARPSSKSNSSAAKSTSSSAAKTSKPASSTNQAASTASAADATATQGSMVWIPQSGSKYHSNSGCSNMKNPSQISKSAAISRGYEPCKKCYWHSVEGHSYECLLLIVVIFRQQASNYRFSLWILLKKSEFYDIL